MGPEDDDGVVNPPDDLGGDGAGAAGNPSGSGGGAGDDGDGGGEPTSLADVAARFEAEALARAGKGGAAPTGAGNKGEGEGHQGKGAAPAPASTDPAVIAYIQKNYNGDTNAFLEAQYKSREESKALAAENARLKAERQGPPVDEAAALKAAREADAEVQSLNQEIQRIQKDDQDAIKRQREIIVENGTRQTKVTELETQLGLIEDPKELARTTSQLSRLRQEIAGLESEFRELNTTRRVNARDVERTRRDLTRAEAEVANRIKQRKIEREDEELMNRRIKAAFVEAFDIHVKPFGMDPKGEQYTFVRESVRALLVEHMAAENTRLTASEVGKAVGALVKAYTKAHNMAPRAQARAKAGSASSAASSPATRRATPTPPYGGNGTGADNGNGTPSIPRSVEDLQKDPNFIRARAREIADARSRGLR